MGKKIIFTLSAAALLGANVCAAGIVSASSNVIQTKAESSNSVVFDFEGNNPFDGWSISSGDKSLTDLLNDSNTSFWDNSHHYYGNGDKFLDMYKTTDTWVGTITSRSFTLGGDGYISALIGGGKDSTSYIDIVDAANLEKSYARLTNLNFLDKTEMSRAECLTFNFVYLPDCVGKDLKLIIRQTAGTTGLQGLTIDDIATGLTKDELKTRFEAEKTRFSGEFTDKCGLGLKELYNRLGDNAFANGDDGIVNPGFESATSIGWTAFSDTKPNVITPVSNAGTYWGENIPTNKTGSYYWAGWNDNTGLAEADSYSLRSTSFTLSGKGYISYSIAGHSSAVEVKRVSDGVTLARFENNAYNVGTFPYVADGLGDSRQGTLAHIVADLSGYVGEELYLVFMDQTQTTTDWGLLFFDDIKTNYEDVPDVNALSDSVTNPTLGSGNNYNADYDGKSGVIKYRTAEHSDDDQKKASEFMAYFKGLRTNGSICGIKNDSAKLDELKTKYNVLTDNAKTIVHASRDYGLTAEGSGTYAECTVLETLAMLGVVELPLNSAKGLLLSNNSSEELAITSIIVGASLLAVGSFAFVTKNRKRKKED